VLPAALADVIHLSGGITKRLWGMPFRANACTGALYHIEICVVSADLDELAAGVYHVDIEADALVPLRSGDFRAALAAAAGHPERLSHVPIALVLTTTYWRDAWKYRARMYRHAFWDGGPCWQTPLLSPARSGLNPSVLTAFADDEVNRLLGVDSGREAALALVGRTAEPLPPSTPVEPLDLEIEPYSPYEIDYPEISAAHRASGLASDDEAPRGGRRRSSSRLLRGRSRTGRLCHGPHRGPGSGAAVAGRCHPSPGLDEVVSAYADHHLRALDLPSKDSTPVRTPSSRTGEPGERSGTDRPLGVKSAGIGAGARSSIVDLLSRRGLRGVGDANS
jgi:SagB-type dehydrogenase family enzyme